MRDACLITLILVSVKVLGVLAVGIFFPASRPKIVRQISSVWADLTLLIVSGMSLAFMPWFIIVGWVGYGLWLNHLVLVVKPRTKF